MSKRTRTINFTDWCKYGMGDFADWHHRQVVEHGLARVRRMLFGDVPQVKTIGIVTAHNPGGEEPFPGNEIESGRENKDRNKSLEGYLRSANYGPIRTKGKYGVDEESFLVPNISREEIVKIGQWFDQEAVIWGEREKDQNNNPYMRFEFIDSETSRTMSVRTVHVGSKDVQDREDFYTMIGGRKFIIPFFDDPHSRKIPGKQYGRLIDVPDEATPWSTDDLAKRVKRVETFFIPFFDNPEAELIFDSKVNEATYYSDRLPQTEIVDDLLEQIKRHENKLSVGGKNGKYYWYHRGVIRECLWKLNRI